MAEKEYIEREKLQKRLNRIVDVNNLRTDRAGFTPYGVNALIEEIPAADVRPVVLCRDCKHYEIDNGWCEYFNVDRVFGDYCSEGENREKS
jgi:hypothetical protein